MVGMADVVNHRYLSRDILYVGEPDVSGLGVDRTFGIWRICFRYVACTVPRPIPDLELRESVTNIGGCQQPR
jgi:hypothetical protein